MSCARIRAETVSTHHQQVAGATGFPPQMAMAAAIDREDPKDVAILRKALQAIADEAMDPGINMPLIPVLDVNQNPDNPIICTRAFSDSPETVAWFGSEYVRALEGAGLIMRITWIDWIIIIAYMLMSLVLGLYFSKKASSNTEEFFLSGRNLPWWLVGTSMVATTFSSDTPLYVTGLVRSQGIYENWQWWCFVISGMLSVTVFAKLWKSAGVMTDVELTEMRYSGRPASILRGFKAIYFSVFIHTIIKGQVILAMVKILDVTMGWNKWQAIFISSGIRGG